MKRTIKVVTAISAVLVSSTALGVAGLDRLVFTPSILFEDGNYVELTLARADPHVSAESSSTKNIAEEVDTLRFAYKHKISDKFGLGFIGNNQPLGVDVNYNSMGDTLRGSVSAKSYIALGHYKATDNISGFGGVKYQTQSGNADLSSNGIPGDLTIGQDSDTGFIVGGTYSIPKIALRASLFYESDLEFHHKTTSSDQVGNGVIAALGGGDTISAAPEALTLELQSGIAEDTLLFGSIRRAKWADAQVNLLGVNELSSFDNTTVYKLGVGRKFSDSFSASVTLNYEKGNGKSSSPFSPQDGERGIALGGKFTAKDGFTTSIGLQYRELGDTTTRPTGTLAATKFENNHVVTVGVKFSKSFK